MEVYTYLKSSLIRVYTICHRTNSFIHLKLITEPGKGEYLVSEHVITVINLVISEFQDWSMCTSKGSFFYEDDEIVTHVYSIRLSEDSAVYFSAYPLQEPQSCKPCFRIQLFG